MHLNKHQTYIIYIASEVDGNQLKRTRTLWIMVFNSGHTIDMVNVYTLCDNAVIRTPTPDYALHGLVFTRLPSTARNNE